MRDLERARTRGAGTSDGARVRDLERGRATGAGTCEGARGRDLERDGCRILLVKFWTLLGSSTSRRLWHKHISFGKTGCAHKELTQGKPARL